MDRDKDAAAFAPTDATERTRASATLAQAFDVGRARQRSICTPPSTSDDLDDTLDYAALHARIVTAVESTSYALLERLASDVLDAVFADHRVARAEVTIAKPGLLDGATPAVHAGSREHASPVSHRAYLGLGRKSRRRGGRRSRARSKRSPVVGVVLARLVALSHAAVGKRRAARVRQRGRAGGNGAQALANCWHELRRWRVEARA